MRAARASKEMPESSTVEKEPALFPDRARTFTITRAETAVIVASTKEKPPNTPVASKPMGRYCTCTISVSTRGKKNENTAKVHARIHKTSPTFPVAPHFFSIHSSRERAPQPATFRAGQHAHQ